MGLHGIQLGLQWVKKVNELLEQENYAAQQEAKKRRDLNLDDVKAYTVALEIIKESRRHLSDHAFQLGKTKEDEILIDLALGKPLTRLCNPDYLKLHLTEIIKGKAEPVDPALAKLVVPPVPEDTESDESEEGEEWEIED